MDIREPRKERIFSGSSSEDFGRAVDFESNLADNIDCGGSSRMIANEVTDFPDPDSPTSPNTCRCFSDKLTLRTAVTAPCDAGNRTVKFRMSSSTRSC